MCVLQALTWDKPESLKLAGEKSLEVADWCWVRDNVDGWKAKQGKGNWMFTQSELKRLEQARHASEAYMPHLCAYGPEHQGMDTRL